MKKLFLIGGTMGVGKTAVSQELKRILPHAAFLDGDWCWDMDPFVVNEETKAMVMENICFCLSGFLKCSAYENIVFCWVMHEQSILDGILSRLELGGCAVAAISLVCSEEVLRSRLQKDIDAGIRKPDVVERSTARLSLYEGLHTIRLDTGSMDARSVAEQIAGLDDSLFDRPEALCRFCEQTSDTL